MLIIVLVAGASKKLRNGRLRRLRRWLAVAGVLILVVVALDARRVLSSPHVADAAPPHIPVTTALVRLRNVKIELAGLGAVSSNSSVTITPQVGGQIIAEPFHEGETVAKGQVLVRIDPAPYRAALDQAIARENQDKANLAGARQDLARYAALVSHQYASAQKFSDQKALVSEDTATVAADAAAVAAAQVNLGFTIITAPTAGRVGLRQIDVGNVVSAGTASTICTVMQMDPIAVIFTLPQQDLEQVLTAMPHGALPVTVTDGSGKRRLAQGTLLTIDNQVSAATGTFQLKAIVPNPAGKLWPGQFVRVRLRIRMLQSVITVPDQAVQRGPVGYYVYEIFPNNKVRRRPVTLHAVSAGIAVVSGIRVGTRVVTGGASRLDNGASVAIPTPSR